MVVDLSEESKSLNSRIVSVSILALVGISLLFVLLMDGWISLNTSPGDPNYVLKEPLREFFTVTIVAAIVSFFPLNHYFKENRGKARLFQFLGLLMNIVGLIGLLLVLPNLGTLAHSGGLTPDFGHILTYDNFTGALWLFLLFSGTVFFIVGYSRIPKSEGNRVGLFLPFVSGTTAFYVGAALYDRIAYIREAGSLGEKFLFSLIIGAIAVIVSLLVLKKKTEEKG